MPKKVDAEEVIARLEKEYPRAKIALHYANPLQLLVATILSAQSTDAGVNKATAALFRKVKTPAAMLKLGEAGLRDCVKTQAMTHRAGTRQPSAPCRGGHYLCGPLKQHVDASPTARHQARPARVRDDEPSGRSVRRVSHDHVWSSNRDAILHAKQALPSRDHVQPYTYFKAHH